MFIACIILPSKAMARSTDGSPKIRATANAARPASTPTSMPRINRLLTMLAYPCLVAGESEQVTSVMQEFMHIHAGNEGGRTFFGADEIEHGKEQQPEHDPGHQLTQRNGRRNDGGAKGRGRHDRLQGMMRPN